MGAQSRAPLRPLNTIAPWYWMGFREPLNWSSTIPRGASLSKSCTPDRCSFSRPPAKPSLLMFATCANIGQWSGVYVICIHIYCMHVPAWKKLYFQFLSHWMVYDHGDNFPFDFKPNEIPVASKLKWKMTSWSYPIQCERNWKYRFLSVGEEGGGE